MPVYDIACPACGLERKDAWLKGGDHPPCESCGTTTVYQWNQATAPHMIGDEIPGGVVIENISHRPQKFYSKSAMKKAADAAGLRPFVRHVGEKGSDKSPHTTRWV